MFDEQTTAQVAAYFLNKAGGTMPHMKLVKLMYLADRLSYAECGHSITGDQAYSMEYGPVLSVTLKLVNGEIISEYWRDVVSHRNNNEISLCRAVASNYFSRLSDAVSKMLDSTCEVFGCFDQWVLSDYTHSFEEWKEPPPNDRIPISSDDILSALERTPLKTPQETKEALERLRDLNEPGFENKLAARLKPTDDFIADYTLGIKERYGA
jgi:uncharacterized phage-associated protein